MALTDKVFCPGLFLISFTDKGTKDGGFAGVIGCCQFPGHLNQILFLHGDRAAAISGINNPE